MERGRRPGSNPCVTFGVYFRTNGRGDVRKFRTPVDASDQEIDHARKTALAFRESFLQSLQAREAFDPMRFREWRTQRLYA